MQFRPVFNQFIQFRKPFLSEKQGIWKFQLLKIFLLDWGAQTEIWNYNNIYISTFLTQETRFLLSWPTLLISLWSNILSYTSYHELSDISFKTWAWASVIEVTSWRIVKYLWYLSHSIKTHTRKRKAGNTSIISSVLGIQFLDEFYIVKQCER